MIHPRPFLMIRHGESEANRAQIISGQTDVALTPLGITQAKDSALKLTALPDHQKPTHIIHSHLKRAIDTAHIVNERLNLPMREDPDVAEQSFGNWEGQPWADIREQLDNGIDPDGGESHQDFHARICRGINRALEEEKEEDGTRPLIVCHGGLFRAIHAMYAAPYDRTPNCAAYHFAPCADAAFPWQIACVTDKA